MPEPGKLGQYTLDVARTFGKRKHISARSVLVTIFGDTVVPAGGVIWLSDLIEMCSPFGFSDRLVRTSLSRLTNEDWFETERVGRRSRYRLTETARDEFSAAERRIYHYRRASWSGQWTLVFTPSGSELATALSWRGYGQLAPGVMAVPEIKSDEVQVVLARLNMTEVPVAVASFEDIGPFVTSPSFAESFGLATAAKRYRELLENYAWMGEHPVELRALRGQAAFAARTMVAHDLRRARLTDPDLPEELTPPDWPAKQAMEAAAVFYGAVSNAADAWVATLEGLSANPIHLAGRLV